MPDQGQKDPDLCQNKIYVNIHFWLIGVVGIMCTHTILKLCATQKYAACKALLIAGKDCICIFVLLCIVCFIFLSHVSGPWCLDIPLPAVGVTEKKHLCPEAK